MTFVWYGEWMIHNDVYMRHVKRMTSNVFVYDRWVRMMCVCNTWMNVYEKLTYDVEWRWMTSNCSSGRNDPFFGKKRHFFLVALVLWTCDSYVCVFLCGPAFAVLPPFVSSLAKRLWDHPATLSDPAFLCRWPAHTQYLKGQTSLECK